MTVPTKNMLDDPKSAGTTATAKPAAAGAAQTRPGGTYQRQSKTVATYKRPPMVSKNGTGKSIMPRTGDCKIRPFASTETPSMFTSILVSPLAARKMSAYIKHCSVEIGWLGSIQEYGNVLFVEDVVLFKQQVSAATTDLDEDALLDFPGDLMDNPPEGKDEEWAMDFCNRVRLWGHSHVNMGVFASGQDEATMVQPWLQEAMVNTDYPYFVRAIGNKRGEMKFDIFYYQTGLAMNDVTWQIGEPEADDGFVDEIVAEMQTKTTEVRYTPKSPVTGYRSTYPVGSRSHTPNANGGLWADVEGSGGDDWDRYDPAHAWMMGDYFDDDLTEEETQVRDAECLDAYWDNAIEQAANSGAFDDEQELEAWLREQGYDPDAMRVAESLDECVGPVVLGPKGEPIEVKPTDDTTDEAADAAQEEETPA